MIKQLGKFGVVGIFCFLIDYFIFRFMNYIFDKSLFTQIFRFSYIISGILSFSVSVIVNYLLSMRFVFVRKDNLSRKKEFFIFVILSIIGLFLNTICLYVGIDLIYMNSNLLKQFMSENIAKNYIVKFGATGIVMIYNFITRKIFLE